MKKNIKIISFVTLLLFLLSVGLSELPNQAQNIDGYKDNTILNTSDGVTALTFGIRGGPPVIDPQIAWDSESYAVIDQVVEGLFAYNLSDPKMGIIPNLALDYGTWSGSNYTVDLKPNIYFHDGTLFDAYAVKFTFDRLIYFIENNMAAAAELYKYYDTGVSEGRNIFNFIEVIDENTIRFVLMQKIATFEALLCFEGSYIVSPISTPATEEIDIFTGTLVGTGPFVYENYEDNIEVNFHAFENYWKGAPNITNLKFVIINDALVRNNALLSGDVDMIVDPLDSMLDIYRMDSNITLESIQGFSINYLAMNDYWINTTFRKAISYAINYTYIIKELNDREVVRMKSPFPENMMYANWSYDVANFNVSKAREIMQGMGFGVGWDTSLGGIDDANWAAASFATFNYTFNIETSFREDLGILLEYYLDQIGINVISHGLEWQDFIFRLLEIEGYNRASLQLYWLSWIPDYNDPHSLLNFYFTNRSSNEYSVPFYDFMVQTWTEEALVETDPSQRNELYNKIQKRLVEELYPWAFGYVPLEYVAYRNEISGFQWNSMQKVSFYEVIGISGDTPPPPPPDNSIYIDGYAIGVGANNWTWASAQDWCSGSGTLEDPYIIKDLIIDGASSGIVIKNSNVYFELVNCTIINGGVDFEDAAIQLTNVTHGNLIGNNCSNNNYYGISLVDCYNCTIFNNFLTNNIYGITARLCQNLNITNNYMENVSAGIGYDDKCFNSIIDNNTIIGAAIGISPGGQNHVLRNNNLESCGIIFFYFFGNINDLTTYDVDTSNTINGKPIYYYVNRNNLVPNDFLNAGQVILINCNNSLISNLDISDSSAGILLYGCNYNNFSNVNTLNETYGLIMYQSSNNLIENSVFSESIYCGIYLYGNSTFNTFENNLISNNNQGIYVGYDSNIINSNIISNNSLIGLSTGGETRDIVIFNNSFIENEMHAAEYGSNHWDNGVIGNYWDDYSGIDANDDGIGDTPYQIYDGSGSSSSVDNFPIWDDGPESPIPQYWVLSPFIIDDDGYGDYTWLEVVNEEWCRGSGTQADPYIVENIFIDGGGMDYCISIRNSFVHFILKNCTFINANNGVDLNIVVYGTLQDGNYSNNLNSGVNLFGCALISIFDNIIQMNGYYGINLYNTNNSVFSDNSISRNFQVGVYSYASNDNIFLDNVLKYNAMFGIFIHGNANQFSRNLMYGTGFMIMPDSLNSYSMVNIPSDNLLDGKPIYFYRDMIGLGSGDFVNASQIILYNCNESLVSGLLLTNATTGIYMVSCNNNLIENNLISDGIYGIALVYCNYIVMNKNNIAIQQYGGIYVDHSNFTSIIDNNIENSTNNGITISGSTNNTIMDNTISYNYNGITIQWNSEYNVIKNNSINNCAEYGILVYDSPNNLIYLNQFEQNSLHAFEYGTIENYWDNGIIGNFWDDYSGFDLDDDGIGDTPYYIEGDAGSQDNYPIWDDGPEGPPPNYFFLNPIIIDNNGLGDYTWAEAAMEDWCSGSGIFVDPYIIQNLIIDCEGVSSGIVIKNSDVYFRIENCSISNSGQDSMDSGINLLNVSNGMLIWNNLSRNGFAGIRIEECLNINITNNSANKNSYGIFLTRSNNSKIIENEVNENAYYGIATDRSNYIDIINNTLIDDISLGIYVAGLNNQVHGNKMFGCGLIIHTDFIHTYTSADVDTSNLINGKPYYFYINEIGLTSLDFANAGEIQLFNCSESIISGLDLTAGSVAVYLLQCNNISVVNNIFSDMYVAIYLDNTTNTLVSYNNLTGNMQGIYLLDNSDYNLISNNQISDSVSGLTMYSSSNNTIRKNIIKNNQNNGLEVAYDSNNNTIYENYFINNSAQAIDWGIDNSWDNGTIGNYWDDYDGVDANDDSIGDTPYNIEGNLDNFPIWDDGLDAQIPQYWVLSPFVIDDSGNGDYTWEEVSNQEWCSGSGMWNDPYVIKNVIINCYNAGNGIYIRNSDVYFKIENCTIFTAGEEYFSGHGIRLEYVTNGLLIDNNCSFNSLTGIYLFMSSNNSIVNNLIIGNGQMGITSSDSNYNQYIGNVLKDNFMVALYIHGQFNTFSNNLMYGSGFLIFPDSMEYHTTEDVDTTNLFNDKPVYFYSNEVGLGSEDFINAGQILLYNCNDSLISDLDLTDAIIGVYMINCHNNVIQNNLISNGLFGLYLIQSNYITISSNNITLQLNGGLFMNQCNFTSIIKNNFDNNNYNAITIYGSSNGVIADNNIINSQQGILLDGCNFISIIGNNIDNNTYSGITSYSGSNVVISENRIANNMQGIDLRETVSDYLIYLNSFIQNTEQATDYGTNNYWDNGTIGNYWDDYNGVDFDDDGIGDSPYLITGHPGSIDNFPIWDDGIDAKTPAEIIEEVITMLQELEVPSEAQSDINKAIYDLNKAIIKFEKGKFYDAFYKIQYALEHLMCAEINGAEVQEAMDALVTLVRGFADDAIDDAIVMVGADNYYVLKALGKYDIALQKLSNGKYDKAVKYFRLAFKNAMKARVKWVPESFLDDLMDRIADIQELKAGDISSCAWNSLDAAESKIIGAINKANNSAFDLSFYKLGDALCFLLEAEDYGVNTTLVIDAIMSNIRDMVYLKVSDAEMVLVGGDSGLIETAWTKYDNAQTAWDNGNYFTAIDRYLLALEKAELALLP